MASTTDAGFREDSGWIQTFSGGIIYPLDPRVEELNIIDIAHGCALNCRYGGQCKYHYSVAQHLVGTATLLRKRGYNRRTVRTGLLHDVFEGFSCDLPHPIKIHMHEYKAAETRFEGVAAQAYNLIFPYPDCIKQADNDMLATERSVIMATPPRPWRSSGRITDEVTIVRMDWEEAEQQFLEFFTTCSPDLD